MKAGQSAFLFSGALTVLGYIGAALFYAYLLGFDTQTPLACPVCPYITGQGGDHLHKFLVWTLLLGTLNGFLLASIGWCVRAVVWVAKKAKY
jgi:hypothetical protein